MEGTPANFVECDQCRGWHVPAVGVCGYKLAADAAIVLDASGACLSLDMIERVRRELGAPEPHRYVSHPEQLEAYLWTGASLSRTPGVGHARAADGAEWVGRMDYPPDVLLIEAEGKRGLIKNLAFVEVRGK